MTTLTPIPHEQQQSTLDHVNEDHRPELLLTAHELGGATWAHDALLDALYEEGFRLALRADERHEQLFIPYPTPDGAAHERLRAAVGVARERRAARDGTEAPTTPIWFDGRVHAATDVTLHLRRVTLRHVTPDRAALTWQPGDAARVALNAQHDLGYTRPYTLRAANADAAEITFDVYHHDDTPGSRWVRALHPGDAVAFYGTRAETLPAWGERPLLAGDETALPTIAALLERWTHPYAPTVLLELQDPADRAYLHGVARPDGTFIHWVMPDADGGLALPDAVRALPHAPTGVWAAAETRAARALRAHLQDERGLPRTALNVTAYWKRAARA
ncbi:SIP domain-containing protein [Deinococcus maricopensis]|uniref:Siderophore-interacting protein n=1 Tax=Deinococcus maricopensis (strain DSM 21211 / LMG 22137 / NRRL B-23946 / LB-34) TaxID=709986 RepID=E8U470_DEIML|nr:SIP domain-containing protein [Deinococcus maricopensis]ADV65907.1 Siderophore-interacting protein [Deinococcus maricopensis DSM 21211]